MPSFTRMKRLFLGGLLWLYLLQIGIMALSLEPGYLDFDNLPETNFTCVGKVIGGYYADLETNCQMFHVCTIGQLDEPMDIRFLCLNGTVFDQETRVCERIDEVDCSKSEQFYSLNLELYGNAGPILEESIDPAQETEPPSLIIKSTTPSTTTTTTSKRPTKFMNTPYFSTTRIPNPTTRTTTKPNVISTHHFPVNPDIRFNPEEINISLNPNAPPDIRTKHFLPQSYSDSHKISVNSNSEVDVKPSVSSSTSPKTIYTVDITGDRDSEEDFGFQQQDPRTETTRKPQQQFLIQTNSFRHSQSFPPNEDFSNSQQYQSSTPKVFIQTPKPPTVHQHHHYTLHSRTDKPPQRVQIPIPLLPTLPPLIFSSPAPFTLQRHIGSKRFTKEHQNPPRIIISASASVSDATGRRLNYSLGTIDAAQILESPPSSYDEYKESDVVLDPFYHDVPKVKQKRKRRSTENKKLNPFEIIKNEKEAVEVLKFLFTWYQSHQATATMPSVTIPVSPDLIHEINDEFAPKHSDTTLLTESSEINTSSSREPTTTESLKLDVSQLFTKNSRFSIIGGYKNIGKDIPKSKPRPPINNIGKKDYDTEAQNQEKDQEPTILIKKIDDVDETIIQNARETNFNPYDYVDDNYEGSIYKEHHPKAIINNKSYKFEENQKENAKEDYVSVTEQLPTSVAGQKTIDDLHSISQFFKYFDLNKPNTSEAAVDYITEPNQGAIKPNKTENLTSNSPENVSLDKFSVETETILPFSTSTATLTHFASTTPEQKSGKRRGRGRQKLYNSHASPKEDTKELYNTKSTSESTTSSNKSSVRRGRKRGRSRFTEPASTSSSTSTTAANIYFTETNTQATFETTLPTELPTFESQRTQNNIEESTLPITSPRTFDENHQNYYSTEIVYHYKEDKSETMQTGSEYSSTHPNTETSAADKNTYSFENIYEPSSSPITTTALPTTSRTRTTTENGNFVYNLLKFFADSQAPKRIKPTTESNRQSYEPITENIFFSSTKESVHITDTNNHHHFDSELKLTVNDPHLPTLRDIYKQTPQFHGELTEKPELSSQHDPSTSIPIQKEEVKNNLLQRLHLIEKNLSEIPTTDLSLADTTATTPYVSFEVPESFGTTYSTVTQPTILDETNLKAEKDLTESYYTNTEPSTVTTPMYSTNNHYNFENDVFVVPEVTRRSKLDHLLWSTTEKSFDRSSKDQTSEHNIKVDVTQGHKSTQINHIETTSHEIDIETSKTLPVSESTVGFAHDINNAQYHNNFLNSQSESTTYTNTNTFMTTEKLQEFIEEVEVNTKSVVAKEDQVRYTSTENYGRTVTETLPTTLLTTESGINQGKNIETTINAVPEVNQNATEILFVKNTDFGKTHVKSSTILPTTIEMETPVKINSSHLLQVMVETSSNPGESLTTTTKAPYSRRTRPSRRRPNNQRNYNSRHRFSTEISTENPLLNKDRLTPLSTVENTTDAPLHRSATPTRSELKKLSLHTTPLSKKTRFPVKINKNYVFNCFGKEMNKFYADPRDCRLFHYCTKGYSKNQLLDLKYVCDRKTFFDEEKLICTKTKPERCV